jgi:hypothetical protein
VFVKIYPIFDNNERKQDLEVEYIERLHSVGFLANIRLG